jgi:hypothetical protein
MPNAVPCSSPAGQVADPAPEARAVARSAPAWDDEEDELEDDFRAPGRPAIFIPVFRTLAACLGLVLLGVKASGLSR